jgi:plastocyanin
MRDLSLKLIALAGLAGAVLIASGCSDKGEPGAPAGGPPPASQSVNVQDNQFAAAAVRLATGGTVRWTWRGDNPHNVTFTGGPASATQSSGTFERTFATAGTFRYICTIHGQSMSGTVTVEAAPPAETR